jgi:hypothetical protein
MGVVIVTAHFPTGQSAPGAVGLTGGIDKSNNDFPSERMGSSFNKADGGASYTLPRFQATQIRLINGRLHFMVFSPYSSIAAPSLNGRVLNSDIGIPGGIRDGASLECCLVSVRMLLTYCL